MGSLSREELRELFDYDLETGRLMRKDLGRVVGTFDKRACGGGYLRIHVRDANYYVHRIVWKWMVGGEPVQIDHIDGNGCNNRWSNLRASNASLNQFNGNRQQQINNTSGIRGVWWHDQIGRWRAGVGKTKVSGTFLTKEEALAARQAFLEEKFKK